jgi:hypothetical protein
MSGLIFLTNKKRFLLKKHFFIFFNEKTSGLIFLIEKKQIFVF